MYFSLGLSLVTFCVRLVEVWSQFVALASRIGGIHVLVSVWIILFFDAFMVLLIWLVARQHKSWARWILLVIFAQAIPGYFSDFNPFGANAKWWGLDGVLSFGQFLSQAIAFFLVFTGNARAWFEQSNQSRN
jgi:hypothetical protein